MKLNVLARGVRPRLKVSAFERKGGKLKRRQRSSFRQRQQERTIERQLREMLEIEQNVRDSEKRSSFIGDVPATFMGLANRFFHNAP
ncbi:hypothetical protein WS67_12145 [Burkholderia singularis]|uniref:Uncharacterized protein n=1 Tax=Burkholderia singularis TaxID=1503053 RepID=A0A103E2N6_9BURK|nr:MULTISPECIES: hypothetical protein [Burkholderia]KVE27245.1 hypothetical protein WS67_12145 [Burkholderia singularis]KVE33738.1 hypothetical protein WS68_11235 [Burkholderia sp. TSV86]